MRYFTIFQDKLHSVIFSTINRWLNESVQKISKITHTASRLSFLWCELSVWSSVWMNFNRVTLQHSNEFIIIIICYLMVSVITMCNLIKLRHFWVLLQAMFMNDEIKRHGQAIKICKKDYYHNKRNIFRWKFTEKTTFIHEDKY